ncbi:MAG: type II toxin-antitoxin system VapC family toxin [Bacteroidota bacterium]
MNSSFVIDTNAYSAFKRGHKPAVEIIKKADNIIFSPIVLAELKAGFGLGNREKTNLDELYSFLAISNVLLLSINESTSDFYRNIYLQLKSNGSPIPTNDIWIASLALQLELPIFTYDKHFLQIDSLLVISDPKDLA